MINNPYARKLGSNDSSLMYNNNNNSNNNNNVNNNMNNDNDDDLYAGFDNMVSQNVISTIVAPTAGLNPTIIGPTTALQRPNTGDMARPMTSVRGAGYKKKAQAVFDPLGISEDIIPALDEKEESTPEYEARNMDKLVNQLIEESVDSSISGDTLNGLSKAKEAAKKERELRKFREKNDMSEQINYDLTYAVLFNLASQYENNSLLTEALNTYNIIVKNRQYPHAGRLRVNMGNIYYRQHEYPKAIKMYRMAMDQIGSLSRLMRDKIRHNIASCFIRLGRFQEAIDHLEGIMDSHPVAQAGFNLIVCYYALGNTDKMKRGFIQLLNVMVNEFQLQSDINPETDILKGKDDLDKYIKQRIKKIRHFVLTAAKLIAPLIEENTDIGYDWIIDHLRAPITGREDAEELKNGFATAAMELEIAKGISCLKRNEVAKAIEVFREVERKHTGLIDQAATNLSFLYYLHGDIQSAGKYSQIAVKADRYNAKALVNKANILVFEGRMDEARELYLEAIGVEADCIEAIYNLGVVNKRMGHYENALQAFKKMHKITPKDPQVIYHLANLYDLLGDTTSAIEWFKILQGIVPSDPQVLARLGTLYSKQEDDNAAFHNYSDCYQAFPVDMKVISWLGVWFVTNQMYERAIHFFERASEIEPDEVKWKLMVASCYRRLRSYAQALSIYKEVHQQEPENLECLRYLVSLAQEFNDPDCSKYQELLKQAEELQEQRTRYNNYEDDENGPDDDSYNNSNNNITPQESPASGFNNSSHTNYQENRQQLVNSVSIDSNLQAQVADKPMNTLRPNNNQATDDNWDDDTDDLLPL